MKVVILAGGVGSRISEETHLKPKPMVEVGERPVLWHVLKIYSAHGFSDFIVCLGYKGYMIKEYFANYVLHMSDLTFDLQANKMVVHRQEVEPWSVTLVNTGLHTATGGRVKRVARYLEDGPFMMTYGDGLADIDLSALVQFHKEHGRLATVTAVQPPGKLGALSLADGGVVESFQEKPRGDGGWFSGGFFVLEPEVLEFIEGDATSFEMDPLQQLASEGQLMAYHHSGFWHPMDTLRDRNVLDGLWAQDKAPWRIW